MKKFLGIMLMVATIVMLFMPCGAVAASGDFTPRPENAYASDFVALCDGEQWFINEIERQLNARQMTLNAIESASDFTYITAIGLNNAGITGRIPPAIGELQGLQYLFLSNNKLSGAIPAELFSLPRLQNVDLSGNSYTGEIPSGFGEMAALSVLNLKGNGFTENIPATILDNEDIAVLNLMGNKLTGKIPAGINGMKGLTYLNLSGNALGGVMPVFSNLDKLVALSLWGCGLTEEIHDSVYGLSKLQILDLADNKLTGEISSDILNLNKLEYLALSNNRLRGTLPDTFPTSLVEVHLENNYLRGTIPDTLKDRYDAGAKVYLENNYLTGDTLHNMTNNAQNFADGATGQYRLTASQTTVQINENSAVNLYTYLRNTAVSGSLPQKPVLNPNEYDFLCGSAKVDVIPDGSGIHVKANEKIPLSDNETITVFILGNDGSEYSKVTIKLTTDTVAAGGGGGGGAAETKPVHEPYVNGYPDGTFKPENSITREEIAKLLITALELSGYDPANASYTDAEASRWSFAYIERATQLGYLNGYGGGIFNPEGSMTRAELATALVRIAESQGKTASGTGTSFTDVDPAAWFGPYVAKAAALGLVTGYSDGTFHPNTTVTRAEAVTMINRLLERDPNTCEELKSAANPFNDITPGHWAYLNVLEASIRHEH